MERDALTVRAGYVLATQLAWELAIGHDAKLDIPILQISIRLTIAANGSPMHKHVLLVAWHGNKTEAFLGVEELYVADDLARRWLLVLWPTPRPGATTTIRATIAATVIHAR